MGAVAAVCALVGAAAGIAGSAAAPSGHGHKAQARHGGGPPGPFGMRIGGPPVHSEAVVPNAAGDGFDTVTMDNGKFKSLSGDQLTITEGTDKATYKDATLTIPGDAKVYRNGSAAQLGDLKDGDRVHVIQGPRGVLVAAHDDQHQPPGPPRGLHGGRGDHDGPDGGPPGPPPFGP
jgi:hypothetical protein